MKLHHTFLGLLVLGGLAFNACSTQKDKFINRNWHAINTEFNTLYNGNLAFQKGLEEINANYRDDYWEILPVERLKVTDEIKLDSEDNNPNFLIAEEKATKAIQKHSMDIKDEERNPQIQLQALRVDYYGLFEALDSGGGRGGRGWRIHLP